MTTDALNTAREALITVSASALAEFLEWSSCARDRMDHDGKQKWRDAKVSLAAALSAAEAPPAQTSEPVSQESWRTASPIQAHGGRWTEEQVQRAYSAYRKHDGDCLSSLRAALATLNATPPVPALKASELGGEKVARVRGVLEAAKAMPVGARSSYDALIDEALEQLSVLSAVPLSTISEGWRPIETAPKDGTSILVGFGKNARSPGGAFSAWWDANACGWVDGCTDLYEDYITYSHVTHWMPLPAPPTPTQDAEGGES